MHRGLFAFIPAVFAVSLGSFLADQMFFRLGRSFRDAAYIRRVQERPTFQRALTFFERHPVGFVFGFRFLYGLRTISSIAIGTTNFHATRFIFINAATALLGGVVFVSIGYFFGQAIEALFGRARLVEIIVATLAVLVIAAYIIRLMLARRQRVFGLAKR